jgi:hypothetical protein
MATETKRAPIYMDAELHRALRMKAADTCSSISQIVNHAVKLLLAEENENLVAFDERTKRPLFSFEDVLKELKRKGRI